LAALPAASNMQTLENEARSLEESIISERDLMIQSLNTLINLSPGGKFNNAFMYRLSELCYEKAIIDFENRLHEYEQNYSRFEKGELKTEPEYPSYNFSEVLSIYKKILQNNPETELTAEILYFTGVCYKKSDDPAKANAVYEVLVKEYPSSDYFLDAMMEIGSYYFNNPSAAAGKGYDHSIEIYKEVLKRRDSDKFIEALYRLAWCYYMQDNYQEAVTVFRHLIEEIDVTETYGGDKTRESRNPMFREEAIEYIAVSLCEVGDLKKVSQFLEMIGNKEYSLMILNRMGQYYEEQLDYDQAV
jgi:tetratricopeptide (TPR) repeat protein